MLEELSDVGDKRDCDKNERKQKHSGPDDVGEASDRIAKSIEASSRRNLDPDRPTGFGLVHHDGSSFAMEF